MDDLISRQETIEGIYQLLKDLPNKKNSVLFKDGVRDGYARAIGRIRSMPSAQPDLDEWCTDCKEYDKDKHCCPRWNRVIREALKDAQPRKGKWIDYSDEGYVECPFCHSATNCDGNKDELHYCFSCGADMREGDAE